MRISAHCFVHQKLNRFVRIGPDWSATGKMPRKVCQKFERFGGYAEGRAAAREFGQVGQAADNLVGQDEVSKYWYCFAIRIVF